MAQEHKKSGLSCPYCGEELYVDFNICPFCGQTVPDSLLQFIQNMHDTTRATEISNPTGVAPNNIITLTHFEELEDDSKTKIGTFEHLYRESILKPKNLGFDDSDYAPLVNLLGSIMELELSRSVYEKLLPYWKLVAKKTGIDNIPNSRECTLGTMCLLIQRSKKTPTIPTEVRENYDFLYRHIGNNLDKFITQLEFIKETRNNGNHKEVISLDKFNHFFDLYRNFYEEYMPILLQLKCMKGSLGYWLFSDMRKKFPIF